MQKRAPGVLIALIACAALAIMGARSPAESQPASGGATYIGSEACKQCHQERWNSFQNSPHARAEADGAVVADHVGCESCHGPGSLHAAAVGDTSDAGFHTIRNPGKMSYQASTDVCLGCHKGGEQFYWAHSNHAANGVGCLSCHSIHHPQNPGGGPMLNAKDVNLMCLTCHKDKRAGLQRSGHMPLREGGMNCADCHNPHGSAGEHQLRAATVNDLCYKCHADKRGPFLWEHPPVRENCLNCHEPHGSNNEKVLAAKRPYLCQRCHIGTRHPSTLYDLPDLQANRMVNRSCQNCHSQIHGSNHPSGKFFER
jgi:DmsE family decaheme c-type cytochrome